MPGKVHATTDVCSNEMNNLAMMLAHTDGLTVISRCLPGVAISYRQLIRNEKELINVLFKLCNHTVTALRQNVHVYVWRTSASQSDCSM